MVAPRRRRLGDGASGAGLAGIVRAAHPPNGRAPARARTEPHTGRLAPPVPDLLLSVRSNRAESLQYAHTAMGARCGQTQAPYRAPYETGHAASERGRGTLLQLPVIYGERGHDVPWHAGRHLQRRPGHETGRGFRGEERARKSCGRASEMPVAAFPADRARARRPGSGDITRHYREWNGWPGESAN